MVDNEIKEKGGAPNYYHTIVVQHIDPISGAKLFDQRCNEYEAIHDVLHRSSSTTHYNTQFTFTMTFCCDGNDRNITSPYAYR